MTYLVGRLPLATLLGPVAETEDRLARLDERVARSDIGEGFAQRADFHDAVANRWVDGELVHLEDLVLHDARMDARTPTHELVIAHRVIRARRRVLLNEPGWAISRAGIEALINQDRTDADREELEARRARGGFNSEIEDDGVGRPLEDRDVLGEELAEIDAVLSKTEWLLGGAVGLRPESKSLTVGELVIRDGDWDEETRISSWLDLMKEADSYPPALAAALLWDGWEAIEPVQNQHLLGPVLISAYLRARGKIGSHLFSFAVGLRGISRERRKARDRDTRLLAYLEAMRHAADQGINELNRLSLVRQRLARRAAEKRKSGLPAAIDLLIARPIVSAAMVAEHAKCTPRGALKLIEQMNLREITGRGRYRAWGIL